MEATLTWSLIAFFAQALQPYSALPSAPPATALAPVDTGGARMVAEGLHGGPVNGAAGQTQYVQVADGVMAVFAKTSGAQSAPPTPLAALYAAASPDRGMRACAVRGASPASVLYDHIGARWLLAWLADTNAYLCVAASAGDNAAGRYRAHALRLPAPGAGHPQLALWRDAVMLTFDLPGRGSRVCAIDSATLARQYPAMRCRDIARSGVIAASLAPGAGIAAGTPALLLALDATDGANGNAVSLWRYAVSANAVSAPLAVPVARYTLACAACIAQPRGGAALPSHAQQLAPHVLFDGRALVFNHTVLQADGRTGIRWYELRAPFGAAQVYQQGTHAPDSEQRWMGGVAVDKGGNIALAYAVSSEATAAGIRYTGRLRTDPPGRMQQEETIVNGSGVQSTPAGLALPGGSLSLDPADGCTFWYTQQYIQTSGSAAWQSRIASFKFRLCR
jgi:hypothetical protein